MTAPKIENQIDYQIDMSYNLTLYRGKELKNE